MSDAEFDVVVAGGGPAGTSTAIRLAGNGLRVALFEKAKFPRPKLCGEFVSPECQRHFDEFGAQIPVDAPRLEKTVFYSQNGRSVVIQNGWFGGSALGISRAAMDTALLNSARDAGAEVYDDTAVRTVQRKGPGLVVVHVNDGRRLAARLVVDATGRNRALASQFEPRARERATHVAFKAHISDAAIEKGTSEIFSYRGGYGGCNRVEGGISNLCFIVTAADTKRYSSDPEEVFRNIVLSNSRAAAVLGDTRAVSEWLAVPITRYGGRGFTQDRVLIVGDAGAFIDPFTGSGILMALEGGEIAASTIATGLREGLPFEQIAGAYHRRSRQAFRRRLSISRIVRHLSTNPTLAEAAIRVLGASTGFRRRLARGTRSNGRLYSNVDT